MNTITIDGRYVPLYGEHDPIALPDLNGDLWRESAVESYEAGTFAVHVYTLDSLSRLFIDSDQGVPDCATVSDYGITEHLSNWSWNDFDFPHIAEWYSAWGLDGLAHLVAAPADYDGPCAVWRDPSYYAGTINAPGARLDRETDRDGSPINEVLTFPTRTKAEAYVAAYYGEPSEYAGIRACNVLSHGQAGADTLTIVKWPEGR